MDIHVCWNLKPQGSIDRLVGLVMKRSYWDKSLQRCAKVHNAGGIACTLFNHFFPEHQDCSNGNFMQFPMNSTGHVSTYVVFRRAPDLPWRRRWRAKSERTLGSLSSPTHWMRKSSTSKTRQEFDWPISPFFSISLTYAAAGCRSKVGVVPTVDILKIGSSASRHQMVVPSSLSPSSRPTSWNVVKSWCLA